MLCISRTTDRIESIFHTESKYGIGITNFEIFYKKVGKKWPIVCIQQAQKEG